MSGHVFFGTHLPRSPHENAKTNSYRRTQKKVCCDRKSKVDVLRYIHTNSIDRDQTQMQWTHTVGSTKAWLPRSRPAPFPDMHSNPNKETAVCVADDCTCINT